MGCAPCYKICMTWSADTSSAHMSVLCLQKMDPQMRKLLEVTHEAFVDSGIDYKSLRGSSKVGVYLGCCGSEVHAMWLSDYNNITGYEQTGCTLSMFANRLSFFFDFKGPSKAVDTGALPAYTQYIAALKFRDMHNTFQWSRQHCINCLHPSDLLHQVIAHGNGLEMSAQELTSYMCIVSMDSPCGVMQLADPCC